MKRILAALSGCSASPATEGDSSAAPSQSATVPAPVLPPESATIQTTPPESSSSAVAAGGSVKEACELFNSLYAQYKTVPGEDHNGYEEIYFKSQDAKETAPGEVAGLFAALSLLAIDHSIVAADGGQPAQASKDAVRDAVFATAGACTAEDVTLRL